MHRWNKEHRYDIICCFFWLWAKIRIYDANPFRQFFFGKLLGCREGHIQHDGVKIPCARCPSRALWTACLHVLVDFFFKSSVRSSPAQSQTARRSEQNKKTVHCAGTEEGYPALTRRAASKGMPLTNAMQSRSWIRSWWWLQLSKSLVALWCLSCAMAKAAREGLSSC